MPVRLDLSTVFPNGNVFIRRDLPVRVDRCSREIRGEFIAKPVEIHQKSAKDRIHILPSISFRTDQSRVIFADRVRDVIQRPVIRVRYRRICVQFREHESKTLQDLVYDVDQILLRDSVLKHLTDRV